MQNLYVLIGDDKFIKAVSTDNKDGYVQKSVSYGDVPKIMQNPMAFYVDDNGVVTRRGWPSGGYEKLKDQINDLNNELTNARQVIKSLKQINADSNKNSADVANQLQQAQQAIAQITMAIAKQNVQNQSK